jgi:hypothetical protein
MEEAEKERLAQTSHAIPVADLIEFFILTTLRRLYFD